MDLQGKVAIVTGGSRGIGRGICRKLASMGCLVYINYVSRSDAAQQTLKEIVDVGGRAEIIGFDVVDMAAVQAGIKKIVGEAGSVHILVNNAGITRDGLMARMKESDWDDVVDTNLKGAFSCAKAVSRTMMKNKWGRIINISSVSGYAGNAGQVNYSAAKAGLNGLTKAMAREYASRNITVNCVAPGYIETDMTGLLAEEVQQKIKEEIALGVFGQVDDVANAVAYFAGESGRYVTGQTLHINGGMYM